LSTGGRSFPGVHALGAADADAIAAARAEGRFVWVDLLDPTPDELARVGDIFGLHPLAIEDATEFDQLPKIDHYQDWLLLVFYGVAAEGAAAAVDLIETHLFVAHDWLVTVRRAPCLSLEHLRHEDDPGDERWIVYRVIDSLTDSFFGVLHALDDRIEALENELLEGDVKSVRKDVIALRRSVGRLTRVLLTQRDILDASAKELAALAGHDDSTAYFRDVQDHLRRLAVRADAQRERLTSAIHLADSAVNTRLTRASERFALIATVFLPLTAVSSFFGMNFSWLVENIDTLGWFLGLGIALPIATLAGLFAFVKRRGYLE
jgi:magnesium transporter